MDGRSPAQKISLQLCHILVYMHLHHDKRLLLSFEIAPDPLYPKSEIQTDNTHNLNGNNRSCCVRITSHSNVLYTNIPLLVTWRVTTLSSIITSLVKKSAPIVALYCAEKRSLTY